MKVLVCQGHHFTRKRKVYSFFLLIDVKTLFICFLTISELESANPQLPMHGCTPLEKERKALDSHHNGPLNHLSLNKSSIKFF